MTRRQWGALPYTDNHLAWRRLIVAVLLRECEDAHAGDYHARRWLHSDQARGLADWCDLPAWPPRLDQLANRTELQKRAAGLLRGSTAGAP